MLLPRSFIQTCLGMSEHHCAAPASEWILFLVDSYNSLRKILPPPWALHSEALTSSGRGTGYSRIEIELTKQLQICFVFRTVLLSWTNSVFPKNKLKSLYSYSFLRNRFRVQFWTSSASTVSILLKSLHYAQLTIVLLYCIVLYSETAHILLSTFGSALNTFKEMVI